MLKDKQFLAATLLAMAGVVFADNSEKYKLDVAAVDEQIDPTPAVNGGRQQTQQAAEQAYPEPPLPTLLQLHDCARRDALLTTQQEQLDGKEAALRAEEARLATRKRAIQAMRSNGSTENLTQAERDWTQASTALKKEIDNFDHLSEPYRTGVLYQVQHCAFSQVRRQDLQQLCQEGTYPRFCAKYQAFQASE